MIAEPGKGLSKEDIERLIANEITAGIQYVYGPDNIAADRDRNYDYYRGIMNDLPAANGRSKVTDRTVASYIDLMLPSLLRIFTAGRNIAEYVSPKDELDQVVRVVTQYINDVVFRKDNRGELMLLDWAKDGLIQKLGTVKIWWEDRNEISDQIHENIPHHQLPAFAAQVQSKGADIVEHSADVQQTPQGPMPVHAVKVRTKVNKSKVCIDVIPPEEYVISRDARNDDDAIMQCHRTFMMVGDLIAMGFDADTVNALPSYSDPYPNRTTKYNQDAYGTITRAQSPDAMLRKVTVNQGIVRCDADGNGIREWYFFAGGADASLKLLDLQPYKAQIFFANFSPQPMPHTVYGRCPADDLSELQKIETVLTRQANDNVFLSNTPQREVVMDWIVKPDQLMNMAPGAPVLVKQPNAIREIAVPFVADKALQMLQYYEGQAELRTGVGRQTAGLNPDALQNQSATANMNMYTAMQGRLEMIARIWAQGGMRKLFRGVLKCIIEYQDFARAIQVDGSPVQADPRQWAGLEDLEVNINTGLGTGNRERDLAVLMQIGAQQKEALDLLGPNNPIVTFKQYVKTLQLQAESAGVAFPEKFFTDPGDWQPPPPQPPQPSPDTVVLAQTEQAKTQQKAQSDQAEIDLKREIAVAEIASNERTVRENNYWNAMLKAEQLGIEKHSLVIEAAKVDASMIRKDMEAGAKAPSPTINIRSDAKDGIESALGKVQGIADSVSKSHEALLGAVTKLSQPRKLIKDPKTGEKMSVVVG